MFKHVHDRLVTTGIGTISHSNVSGKLGATVGKPLMQVESEHFQQNGSIADKSMS